MALLSLPEELTEAIAANLDIADFRAFRLSHRSLEHKTVHHFTERFFRKHTISWHAESFRSILDIVSSSTFGDALQDLVIDATPRHAIRLWEIRSTLAEDPHSDTIKDLYDIEQTHIKKTADASSKFWNESRYDRKCLTFVFEKIKALRSITFAYDGMDRVHSKFGRQYCISSQHEMSRPFVSIMDAIAASDIRVNEILIDSRRHHGAVSIGRLETLAKSLPRFDCVFEHLQALQVDLRDWRYPDEGFEPSVDRPSFAVRFLAKCKNIRKLEVSCFSSFETGIFSDMAKMCYFPHLESCTLKLFRLDSVELLKFLEPCRTSLRSLALSHIVLRDDMIGWPEMMQQIADRFDLKALELANLFNRMGARVGIDGTLKGVIQIEGPGLADQLRGHASHLIYGNWGPAWYLASVAYPFVGLRA